MRIRILALSCLSFLLVGGCTNLDEINTRLDSLESRVSALEQQITALNQNVAATAALMQAGTIISAVQQDGEWTITLNNGQVIKLVQGSEGEAVIPVMTIDSEGYWMIDYGTGASYILQNGQKVKACGTDGITPIFSVNTTGHWTVSYNNGVTWQEVLTPDGKPVSAIPEEGAPEQDPYFKSVSYDNDCLVVVLKDNTTLQIPIVSDFYCVIAGADKLQEFSSGQTRRFEVSMSKVAQTFVTVPAGWAASLTGSTLSVTAPVSTKATLANTATDVSILALSAAGAAALAKIQVSLSDGSSPSPDPTDPGDDQTPVDYYESWQKGDDIIIAGVIYNKAQYGEGALLVADEPNKDIKGDIHTKSGVFFLEEDAEGHHFSLASTAIIQGGIVLIGRYSDKKVTIVPSSNIYFALKSGMLVMKNLSLDMSVSGKYLCNNNAGDGTVTFMRWHMEDCNFLHLGQSMLYANSVVTGIQSLIVRNCFFEIASSGNLQLFNFSNTTALYSYKELAFSNNEVYAANPTTVQVFQYNQNINQDSSQDWDATMKADNNLFYNCVGANGYFKYYRLASLSMTRNIFWADSEFDSASYGFILYSAGQDASAINTDHNIAYGLSSKRNWLLAHTGSAVIPNPNIISKVHEDPIAAYTPGVSLSLLEPYREYGPQR